MPLTLTLVGSVLLYAPGAFFFYPWKPFAQAAFGDSYHVGYAFFRRDHSEPTNVCLHLVALLWQLLGNFGLLNAVDRAVAPLLPAPLGVHRPLSMLTAALWVVTLMLSPAPLGCSLLSSLLIVVVCWAAPMLTPSVLELGAPTVFVSVLTLSYLSRGQLRKLARGLGIVLAYFGLALILKEGAKFGATALRGRAWATENPSTTNLVLVFMMGLLGALPKPTIPCVVGGVAVVRALGELTRQDALTFYGAAFLAQLSQGVAHKVSGQEATLLSHEKDDSHDRGVKLAFEWSHVTFFPNFLLHACHDELTCRAESASNKNKSKIE
jgi:hypothetical protein